MQKDLKFALLALVGIACGFAIQDLQHLIETAPTANNPASSSDRTIRDQSQSREISHILADPDSSQVTHALDLISGFTDPSDCLNFATRLLNDPNNCESETLWCLILARWSELDPQGMIDFVEGQPDPDLRSLAWEAWAATDPDLLATKVISMGPPKSVAILKGIASRNPDLALETAFRTPDTNSIIWELFQSSPSFSEETIRKLLQKAAYDGMRNPMLAQLTETLAEKDPKEALAFLQEKGRIWADPTADLFKKLALKDPKEAIDLLNAQTDSRSKAISTVQIAKTWAAQDPEASLAWARSQSSAQIRDTSLVAIASVIGGEDPERGLALLDEIAWKDVGLFYAIGELQTEGNIRDQIQEHDIAMTHQVGRSLLENLAGREPEAAKQYILTQVPEDRRAALLTIFDTSQSE